jgi:hypothetical protein
MGLLIFIIKTINMKFNIPKIERQSILDQHSKEKNGHLITEAEEIETTTDITLLPIRGSEVNKNKLTSNQLIKKGTRLIPGSTNSNGVDTVILKSPNLSTEVFKFTYYCGKKKYILHNPGFSNQDKAEYDEGTMMTLLTWIEKNMCYKKTEDVAKANSDNKTVTDDTKTKQCALGCNERYPYYSVVCDGYSWKKTLNSWISEKGGGDNKETYRALRTSWCSGWRPGQTSQTPENLIDFIVPIFPDQKSLTQPEFPNAQNNNPTEF